MTGGIWGVCPLDRGRGYFVGLHSRAIRCASAIWAGVIDAVVLSRGDQKGAVISRHRTRDAAVKAVQAGGVNWSVREIGDDGLAKK